MSLFFVSSWSNWGSFCWLLMTSLKMEQWWAQRQYEQISVISVVFVPLEEFLLSFGWVAQSSSDRFVTFASSKSIWSNSWHARNTLTSLTCHSCKSKNNEMAISMQSVASSSNIWVVYLCITTRKREDSFWMGFDLRWLTAATLINFEIGYGWSVIAALGLPTSSGACSQTNAYS